MSALLIRIRIIGTDKFVGGLSSWAFRCDKEIAARTDDYYTQGRYLVAPAWFVPEHKAKVWTDTASLCRLLSKSAEGSLKWHQTTWSTYEVVLPDGTATPLDTWLTDQGLRP